MTCVLPLRYRRHRDVRWQDDRGEYKVNSCHASPTNNTHSDYIHHVNLHVYFVCVGLLLRLGHAQGLRPDHQLDPGRESRARVQLWSGCGASCSGTLHRPGGQRVRTQHAVGVCVRERHHHHVIFWCVGQGCDRRDRRGDGLHTGPGKHPSRASQLCRPLMFQTPTMWHFRFFKKNCWFYMSLVLFSDILCLNKVCD